MDCCLLNEFLQWTGSLDSFLKGNFYFYVFYLPVEEGRTSVLRQTLTCVLLFFEAANLPLHWHANSLSHNWFNVKRICTIPSSVLWLQVRRDKPGTEDLNLKVRFLFLNILSPGSMCESGFFHELPEGGKKKKSFFPPHLPQNKS